MRRTLAILSAVCLAFTVLWLAFFVWEGATRPPVTSLDEAVARALDLGVAHTITYLNATLVTISAVALMAALYAYCGGAMSAWNVVAFAFVPIYGLLNLMVYLSQVAILPRLAVLLESGADGPLAPALVAQMAHYWSDSAMAILNGTAYAVLGIPSIIWGAALARGHRTLRATGWLLAANGVACIMGLIGILTGIAVLGLGSVVGGVLFLLALIGLVRVMWRGEAPEQLQA